MGVPFASILNFACLFPPSVWSSGLPVDRRYVMSRHETPERQFELGIVVSHAVESILMTELPE